MILSLKFCFFFLYFLFFINFFCCLSFFFASKKFSFLGMLLATEIAKLVSFGELYNLLVRVSREMILGETGGMQYAEDLVREVVLTFFFKN